MAEIPEPRHLFLKKVWEGDLLERSLEADMLEDFLINQADGLAAQKREHAYVFSIDARYGEGKSFFLDRFASQLRKRHAVATLDAWADDTNDQPLVALMAAIEDGFKPYFRNKKIREAFLQVRASLLPVIAAAGLGVVKNLGVKYLGDGLDNAAGIIDISEQAQESATFVATATGSAAEATITKMTDRYAEKMLSDYRTRKQSVDFFKIQLKNIVSIIRRKDAGARVFIIVDELDRCRPIYAIKMLEEIKHLFDVAGIVFVIGLHRLQLQYSINAVYGEQFNSRDYLARFFSRNYTLKTPSMKLLTAKLFSGSAINRNNYCHPKFRDDQEIHQHAPDLLVSKLLAHWKVNAREAYSVVDAMKIFETIWGTQSKIELVLLIAYIVSRLNGNSLLKPDDIRTDEEYPVILYSSGFRADDDSGRAFTPKELLKDFLGNMSFRLEDSHTLPQPRTASSHYLRQHFQTEFSTLHNNSVSYNSPSPITRLQDYPKLVEMVGQFQPEAPKDEKELD